ncbi:MAG: ABC transporter permease [Bacteroidales bacterium]|jgi:putative ABC transport system permease protein|nr:ABC transporter permease [Bacteroidales bacterium]
MFDLDRIEEIWETITRNKVRSLLTGFGVFWGIFMLTVMMGAGQGLQRGVSKGLEGFATNSCFIGSAITGKPYEGFQRGRRWHIKNSDVDMLQYAVPNLSIISPVLFRQNVAVNFEGKGGQFNVRGLHSNYRHIENPFIVQGRFFNEIDLTRKRKVCIIGTKVYEEMFPASLSPIGRYLQIGGVYYQVVGVVAGVSNISINGQMSEAVLLPFTTMQQVMNLSENIHMIAATAKAGTSASKVEAKIKELLKRNNHIAPDDNKALWSVNAEEQFNLFQNLFAGLEILIWIVGSGTLIAGIVGVSNIMLVTVKERTREIGVRRAIGARPGAIISQVMAESLMLTGISGMLGLSVGILFLHVADTSFLQKAENIYLYRPMITFGAAVRSIIVLLLCGLTAGAIPTLRALKIKAIDAIREE